MRRHPFGIAVLLAIALLLAACGSAKVTPVPTVPAALGGTSWVLGIQGGTAPAATTPQSLVFDASGSLSGFAGCGPYTGSWTVNGSAISITNVAATPTQNTCAPETLTAQAAYLLALGQATQWMAGDLSGAIPTGVKVLAPVKLSLTGPPTPLIFTLQ